MRAHLPHLGVALCLLTLGGGCVKLKPVVLDRKTQLENQILGSFQRLEQELILASSVRGKPRAAVKLSPLQREAVEAMMVREFYRDDIEALKQEQVVGEGNGGLLVLLSAPDEPARAKEVKRLLETENQSRQTIMRQVVRSDRELSQRDMPLVARVFYRLNLQTAQPGERVQAEDGRWSVVQKPEGGEPQQGASAGARGEARSGANTGGASSGANSTGAASTGAASTGQRK